MLESFEEDRSVCEGFRLFGSPCANLIFSRAGVVVGVGLVFCRFFGGSANADLSAEGLPVKAKGSGGARSKFLALLAAKIGKKGKAASRNVADEDHAAIRKSVKANG